MADAPSIPSHADLMWPTIKALRALGGSGSINEIVEKVVELEGFTEEQQAVPHGDGPQGQIEYRLAWARTYLKGMGLLDNSARGVWTLTEKCRDPSLDERTVLTLHAEYTARLRAQQRTRRKAERDRGPADVHVPDQDVTRDWKEELLEALLAMPPAGFERLAQRLLREAGFISATVMGRRVTAASTDWACIGCRWSAFLSTSSASATGAASGQASCGTSEVPWPGAATRAWSSRPAASLVMPSVRRPGTALRQSTSSMAMGYVSYSSGTSLA
jgi:Mrr N-terminal domain